MKRLPFFLVLCLSILIIYFVLGEDEPPPHKSTSIPAQSRAATLPQASRSTKATQEIKKDSATISVDKKQPQTARSEEVHSSIASELAIDNTNNRQPTNRVFSQETPPLWGKSDVIEQGYQQSSDWVHVAEVLAVVDLPKDILSNLGVGKAFSLPVGENPTYRIEQEQNHENGDISWMAVYLTPKGEVNRYGVISDGSNLLLMTLYTDTGAYYLRSSDKGTAEVSFVDYQTLRDTKGDQSDDLR